MAQRNVKTVALPWYLITHIGVRANFSEGSCWAIFVKYFDSAWKAAHLTWPNSMLFLFVDNSFIQNCFARLWELHPLPRLYPLLVVYELDEVIIRQGQQAADRHLIALSIPITHHYKVIR